MCFSLIFVVGVNSVIRYALEHTSGNASEYFHIDPEEGAVYLKRSLDHETRDLHHLVIVARDSGTPTSLHTSVHVWVTG